MKAGISFMRARIPVRTVALLLLLTTLSACQIGSDPTILTLRQAGERAGSIDGVPLDLNYRYLRFALNGHPVIIALGYVEADSRGSMEVWYGADRQMLRLQNGRLLAIVGFPVEWRSVSVPPLPSWSELAQTDRPVKWTRIRDVMPGYRYGVRDELVLRRIDAPSKSELKGLEPGKLTWFEEQSESSVPPHETLPPARYAVDLHDGQENVVYAEQCLAPDICLSWQRWPVAALRADLRKADAR